MGSCGKCQQGSFASTRGKFQVSAFWLGLALMATPSQATAQIANEAESGISPGSPAQKIGQLIEDLGSDDYATRNWAREQLQQRGLEAFEQLQKAQFHADIEIEMAAKYLVGSLLIRWGKETDPVPVQEILLEYGAQIEPERLKRIGMLEFLANRSGLEALVRLVRYEKSEQLSRQAALSILRQSESKDQASREQDADVIRLGITQSTRRQAAWLTTYADDLQRGTYSDAQWRKMIQRQRDELDNRTSEITRESVLELVRTCAGNAAKYDHRAEATRLATDHLDLLEPTTRSLTDACTWGLTHGLHEFVLEIRREFNFLFDQQPGLLYAAAEAHQLSGDDGKAEELAGIAIAINGFPTGEDAEKMAPRDLEQLAMEHRSVANDLQERGLFQWCFREYELVIHHTQIDSVPNWTARLDLARQYKSHEMHEDVIRIIEPLLERVEKDEQLEATMGNLLQGTFTVKAIRAMLNHALAQRAIANNQLADAQRLLSQAFEAEPSDIDVLIQMYHTDGDKAWHKKVKQQIHDLTGEMQRKIAISRQGRQPGFGPFRSSSFDLAELLNNTAWLIANTEGDYELALKYSLESLEQRRDGARLDTCARCYFAAGQVDQAIATQKEAIQDMPHAPELKRQLKEFEKAQG